jgi:hypothetical protein
MKEIDRVSAIADVILRVCAGNSDADRYGGRRQGPEQIFIGGIVADADNEIVFAMIEPK